MHINEAIGQYLRRFRLKNGFSIEDVAGFTEGITTNKLSSIEAGHEPVALNELYTLANIYGIAPDELVAFLFEMATQAEHELSKLHPAGKSS